MLGQDARRQQLQLPQINLESMDKTKKELNDLEKAFEKKIAESKLRQAEEQKPVDYMKESEPLPDDPMRTDQKLSG